MGTAKKAPAPKITPASVTPANSAPVEKVDDPDTNWIAYKDEDGKTQRVTVEEYQRLGL